MKLSVWAKQNGLSYKGAYRMWKVGQLPVPAEQLPTGTILVRPSVVTPDSGVALYARVSSSDQKPDLERQVARLAVYAAENGWRVMEIVKEVGTGLGNSQKIFPHPSEPGHGKTRKNTEDSFSVSSVSFRGSVLLRGQSDDPS